MPLQRRHCLSYVYFCVSRSARPRKNAAKFESGTIPGCHYSPLRCDRSRHRLRLPALPVFLYQRDINPRVAMLCDRLIRVRPRNRMIIMVNRGCLGSSRRPRRLGPLGPDRTETCPLTLCWLNIAGRLLRVLNSNQSSDQPRVGHPGRHSNRLYSRELQYKFHGNNL